MEATFPQATDLYLETEAEMSKKRFSKLTKQEFITLFEWKLSCPENYQVAECASSLWDYLNFENNGLLKQRRNVTIGYLVGGLAAYCSLAQFTNVDSLEKGIYSLLASAFTGLIVSGIDVLRVIPESIDMVVNYGEVRERYLRNLNSN